MCVCVGKKVEGKWKSDQYDSMLKTIGSVSVEVGTQIISVAITSLKYDFKYDIEERRGEIQI